MLPTGTPAAVQRRHVDVVEADRVVADDLQPAARRGRGTRHRPGRSAASRTPSQPAIAPRAARRAAAAARPARCRASQRLADRAAVHRRGSGARRRRVGRSPVGTLRSTRAAACRGQRRADERPDPPERLRQVLAASSRTRSGCGPRRPRRRPCRRGRRRRPRQQPVGELGAGQARPGDVREDVERALRAQAADAGDRVEPVDDEVAPGAELRDHRRRHRSCGPGAPRPRAPGRTSARTLIVLMISCRTPATSHARHDRVAQPPAGHRVGLGEAVEDDRPLGHARQRRDRDVLRAVVQDPAVDLVGEDRRGRGAIASSAIRSMSPRVSTPPVGLAGELMTSSFVRGVTSEASSSRSSRKSFSSRIGIGTGVAADEAGHRLVDRVARDPGR